MINIKNIVRDGFLMENIGSIDLAYACFEKAVIQAKAHPENNNEPTGLSAIEMNRWIVGVLLATDYGYCSSNNIVATQDPLDLGFWVIDNLSKDDPVSLFWKVYFEEQVLGVSFNIDCFTTEIDWSHIKAIYLNDQVSLERLMSEYKDGKSGVVCLLESYREK